jgi:CyaY protein
MLDDQQFKLKADAALERLYNALAQASDEYDFECDFDGAVKLEFEDPPAKFVVSPNSPVRQIWVSAHSKSYKLDWDAAREEFVLADSGQSLTELMADAVSRQIGEEVRLG